MIGQKGRNPDSSVGKLPVVRVPQGLPGEGPRFENRHLGRGAGQGSGGTVGEAAVATAGPAGWQVAGPWRLLADGRRVETLPTQTTTTDRSNISTVPTSGRASVPLRRRDALDSSARHDATGHGLHLKGRCAGNGRA